MSKKSDKIFNLLYGAAIIILIATVIRTLAYYIIGLQTERVFSNTLFITWGITLVIIIYGAFIKRSKQ